MGVGEPSTEYYCMGTESIATVWRGSAGVTEFWHV